MATRQRGEERKKMMFDSEISQAKQKIDTLLRKQLDRVERMKTHQEWIDYEKIHPIVLGMIAGDGIGLVIARETRRALEALLSRKECHDKVFIREVEGLTIENRASHGKAIPDEVLAAIKECHILLKGPTTTPRAGDPWPNIESANVAIRKELDLFANVRPVRVLREGIDWTFFRENTEGEYVLGKEGFHVTEDLAVDFKVITTQGCIRILRLAFDYARKNGYKRVTLVTKANVIKTTDGKFLDLGKTLAKEYPEIECDDWYVDIMSAKLLDPKRRKDFQVIVLPNLYGDILTDEAAEIQGGVGTAGSANIGMRYSMFEAIHGSAPRMVEEGRDRFADPSSLMRAASMMLLHIGMKEEGQTLEMALDLCCNLEKNCVITGRDNGATSAEFTDYLLDTMASPNLESRWKTASKMVS